MQDQTTSAEFFESRRPRLFGIAYRMLGIVADAEDVVQDAFLRWTQADATPRSDEAWLVSVTTRLSIDRLRRAATERAAYAGQWLPEPIPSPPADSTAELADDLSIAFLVLLERLAPEERAAFLLREVFDTSYAEIARTLGKTEIACRQVVSRARERVRLDRRRFAVAPDARERVARQFVAALSAEDQEGVLALLSDDALLVADGGGRMPALPEEQHGAARIAQLLVGFERQGRVQLERRDTPPMKYQFAWLNVAGHEVTAIGRSPDRLKQLAAIGATPAMLNLFDRDAVTRTVKGHAAVVNLATHVPGTGMRAFLPGAWSETDRIRREGSAILADAVLAAGAERFIQESFALIYPDSGARWVDELVTPRPASYNRTVMDAEASAERVTAAGRVGVALRFSLLYGGAEDRFTRDVLRYAKRGWLPLLGNPDGYLPMVTHDDAAGAVVAAVGAPAGVYNVGDDEPLTRRVLAHALGQVLSVPAPRLPPKWIASVTGSVGETIGRSVRLSNHALRNTTSWKPACRSGREGWRAAANAISAELSVAIR